MDAPRIIQDTYYEDLCPEPDSGRALLESILLEGTFASYIKKTADWAYGVVSQLGSGRCGKPGCVLRKAWKLLAIFMYELESTYKVSLRSKYDVDVTKQHNTLAAAGFKDSGQPYSRNAHDVLLQSGKAD